MQPSVTSPGGVEQCVFALNVVSWEKGIYYSSSPGGCAEREQVGTCLGAEEPLGAPLCWAYTGRLCPNVYRYPSALPGYRL